LQRCWNGSMLSNIETLFAQHYTREFDKEEDFITCEGGKRDTRGKWWESTYTSFRRVS
jgi:hypothetical protein